MLPRTRRSSWMKRALQNARSPMLRTQSNVRCTVCHALVAAFVEHETQDCGASGECCDPGMLGAQLVVLKLAAHAITAQDAKPFGRTCYEKHAKWAACLLTPQLAAASFESSPNILDVVAERCRCFGGQRYENGRRSVSEWPNRSCCCLLHLSRPSVEEFMPVHKRHAIRSSGLVVHQAFSPGLTGSGPVLNAEDGRGVLS